MNYDSLLILIFLQKNWKSIQTAFSLFSTTIDNMSRVNKHWIYTCNGEWIFAFNRWRVYVYFSTTKTEMRVKNSLRTWKQQYRLRMIAIIFPNKCLQHDASKSKWITTKICLFAWSHYLRQSILTKILKLLKLYLVSESKHNNCL